MPARPGAGRPSKYTPELAERICEAISLGQYLGKICEAPDMPHRVTVHRWMDEYPEFATRYARARELQADVMDEDILSASRAVLAGEIDPRAGAVAIGGFQWRAGRLNAQRYGDRQQVDVSGKLTLEQIVAAAMKPKGENKG